MDQDIYGSAKDKFAEYVTSIAANEDEADDVSHLYCFRVLSHIAFCLVDCRTTIIRMARWARTVRRWRNDR